LPHNATSARHAAAPIPFSRFRADWQFRQPYFSRATAQKKVQVSRSDWGRRRWHQALNQGDDPFRQLCPT